MRSIVPEAAAQSVLQLVPKLLKEITNQCYTYAWQIVVKHGETKQNQIHEHNEAGEIRAAFLVRGLRRRDCWLLLVLDDCWNLWLLFGFV